VARLAGCSEEAARGVFQTLRSKARKFLQRHLPTPPAAPPPVPPLPPPADAAGPSATAVLAQLPARADVDGEPDAVIAIATVVTEQQQQPPPAPPPPPPPRACDADAALFARLLPALLPCGALALPCHAALLVSLMRASATPGFRASLADTISASRPQLGVPGALVDAGAFAAIAEWLDAAVAAEHTTVLRRCMRALCALPVNEGGAAPLKPLAKPMLRVRMYARAPDVAAEATRIMAGWAKAVMPGATTAQAAAQAAAAAAAAAAAGLPPPGAGGAAHALPHAYAHGGLPHAPLMPPPAAAAFAAAAAPFAGPPMTKSGAAALAARVAAPPAVAARSAADRLAGANDRAAAARPLSADEIMRQRNKKRMLLGSGGGSGGGGGGGGGVGGSGGSGGGRGAGPHALPPELAKRLKLAGGILPPGARLPSSAPAAASLAPSASASASASAAASSFPHAPPQQQQQQQQQQQPAPMRARVAFALPPAAALPPGCCDEPQWGSESSEAGAQARREASSAAAVYLLPSLVPDDPATPLHVSHEALGAALAPPPLRVPDVPLDPEDAAAQAARIAAAGYGPPQQQLLYGGMGMGAWQPR
jgi:hypothetical protein